MSIKVYGGHHRIPGGAYERCIVAAKSKKQAAELFGVSAAFFNSHYSVAGNKAELEAALAQPGVVLKVMGTKRTQFEPLTLTEAAK